MSMAQVSTSRQRRLTYSQNSGSARSRDQPRASAARARPPAHRCARAHRCSAAPSWAEQLTTPQGLLNVPPVAMCGAIAAAGSNRQWLAQARIAPAHDRDRGLGRCTAMTSWWAAGLSRSCSLCPGLAGSSGEGPSTESSGLSQSPDDLAHPIGQKSALLRAWAVVNVGLAAKVL